MYFSTIDRCPQTMAVDYLRQVEQRTQPPVYAVNQTLYSANDALLSPVRKDSDYLTPFHTRRGMYQSADRPGQRRQELMPLHRRDHWRRAA